MAENGAVNVQAAVDIKLLGIDLTGMVSRITDKLEDGTNQTTTEFLVMPSKLDEESSFQIKDVVKEINRTIYMIEHNVSEEDAEHNMKEEDNKVSEDTVNNALDVVGLKDASLTFMQTFIHYKKVENAKAENPDSIIEYAFGIHVKGSNPPSSDDFKFLAIKDVYVNVWNTKNEKVLERMQILSMDLLEQIETKPE